MELRHLRYFVAVAEELSFRKAAERLHVTQPGLSTQVRDLEDEMGVKLLDRDTTGVRLTDAGTDFLPAARQILSQTEQAVEAARETAKGQRGRLTVGYIAPLLVGFMPASLKKFNERFPKVEVTLLEMPIVDQLVALGNGNIQVGFTIRDLLPLPAGLQQAEVVRAKIGVIMAREHRLAKFRRVPVDEVVKEPLVSLSVKKGWSVHGDLLRSTFAARGIKHRPIRAIEGTETFRATLESGLAISLVAGSGSLSRSRDLTFKPLKETGEDLTLVLHALWREGEASQAAANFIAVVKEINGAGRRA